MIRVLFLYRALKSPAASEFIARAIIEVVGSTYRTQQQPKRATVEQTKKLLTASLGFLSLCLFLFLRLISLKHVKERHLDIYQYPGTIETVVHLKYYADEERVPRTFTVSDTSERWVSELLPSR